MRKVALSVLIALLATPALAHPGNARAHELLSSIEHMALTALPVVVVVALIGLAVFAFLRKT